MYYHFNLHEQLNLIHSLKLIQIEISTNKMYCIDKPVLKKSLASLRKPPLNQFSNQYPSKQRDLIVFTFEQDRRSY